MRRQRNAARFLRVSFFIVVFFERAASASDGAKPSTNQKFAVSHAAR
jgi:hypothetical protein